MWRIAEHSAIRASSVVIVTAAVAMLAHPALGADDPPAPIPDGAAINQYRESLPTSIGQVASGGGQERLAPLPAPVLELVRRQGGNDAPVLEDAATSSAFGAPQERLPAPDPVSPRRGAREPREVETSAPLLAAVARSASADARTLILLAAMLVIVTATTAATLRRQTGS